MKMYKDSFLTNSDEISYSALFSGWSPGTCQWYGRAELKQSDHRPILSLIDVEVHQVNEKARETVFQEALQDLGPPDGSVLLQFDDVIGADLNEIVDDHFTESLKSKIIEELGELRFIKFINEMIWVAFNNYSNALEAAEKNSIEVCGHTLTISLKNPNWRETLNKELELCSAKGIPLCNSTKELQNLSNETKRNNLSQLSQLSFEELGGKLKQRQYKNDIQKVSIFSQIGYFRVSC